MASTSQGSHLTELHRRAQIALRAVTLRQLLTIWPAFDLADIDGSWGPVEEALVALVSLRRRDSVLLSARYFEQFRAAEGIPGAVSPRLAVPPSPEVLRYSLGYTGPITAKKLVANGRRDVLAQTFTHTAGNTARLVMNGGRETVVANVEADRRCLGHVRVTSGDPCSFCAMLASRGPVYRRGGGVSPTSDITFAAHSHCACHAEPVYRTDTNWPGRAGEFRDLWNESTQGLSGDEASQAFRRAIEGR